MTILEAVLNYDKDVKPQSYYFPEKTSSEIKKEWDSIK
jgi:hypothetical protein